MPTCVCSGSCGSCMRPLPQCSHHPLPCRTLAQGSGKVRMFIPVKIPCKEVIVHLDLNLNNDFASEL